MTFGLSKKLLRAVQEAGFESPRPIQAKTIPQVLQGRDVLGLAQTGTGKTAAFALPILEQLSASRGQNPRALIVAPTRELALQIHAETELLAKYTGLRAITIFGGVGAAPQIKALRARPDIIIACPGRLLDLARGGNVDLSGVSVLVLDEADHMFDMGFLPDIKRILALLPARRQNLLFSATMPREIRGLTDRILKNPHVVELAHSAPAETIEHALYPVEQSGKTALLKHLLARPDFRSAIVFLRTKHRARRLAQDLDRAGHRAIALQGNMSQGQRQRAMQGFRDGHYDVLVATDIAARGIDVAQVSHVINFDVPNTPDAYTHRIGRTGRAERSGQACTFVTSEDYAAIQGIERRINMKIPRVTVDGFASSGKGASPDPLAGGRGRRSNGGGGRGAAAHRPKRGGGTTRASRPAASPEPARAPEPARPVNTTPFGSGVSSNGKENAKPAASSFGAGVSGDAKPRGPEREKPARSKNGRKRQRMRSRSSRG